MSLGVLPLVFCQKTDIFVKINSSNCLLLDNIFYYISFLGSGYTYVICLFLLMFFRINNRILLNGSSALLLLTIIVKTMKLLIFSSNHRPIAVLSKEYSIHLVKNITLKHASSFPSGHASIIFSLALFLILNFNFNTFLKFVMLILALMVTCSRIYLGQHFYIDVYIGALVGGLSTILFYSLINNTKYAASFLNTDFITYILKH